MVLRTSSFERKVALVGLTGLALSESQIKFIRESHLYFVATSPNSPSGHINCSPRPVDWSFILDSPSEVGWFDLVGSGIETISHLKENGRIVLMFCSFGAVPLIMRLHGRGFVHEPGSAGFERLMSGCQRRLGIRAVIKISIERVSTSCGYGVPLMDFVTHRPRMDQWVEQKGESGLVSYRKKNNVASIDGLEGLDEDCIS